MPDYETKIDNVYGHRVLYPTPSPDELKQFFKDRYYDLVQQGERAVDIARTMRGGDEAADQARWQSEVIHSDIIDIALREAPTGKVVEVGCGMGNLLADLKNAGFEPTGVDVALEAVMAVRKRGMNAYEGAFDDLAEDGTFEASSIDIVIFNNVLELTHDPLRNLRAASRVLRDGGLLIVRGGNDFNPLQRAAVDSLGIREWWVSPPEHINYLNFEAVEAMMRAVSVEPFHRHGEFPMELWLLFGFDYVTDRALGADCHRRRVAMERALPAETRRGLYQAFGAAGIGRTMVVAGRKPT